MDDASLRRRVHQALAGIAHELEDVGDIGTKLVGQAKDEQCLILVGPRVAGVHLTPAAVLRLRTFYPLAPIFVCVPLSHSLQYSRALLAIAGADRVISLDAFDTVEQLRYDAREALRHALPQHVELGVESTARQRTVALQLFCARNAYAPLKIGPLADQFHVDRSTILKDAKEGGWDSAQCMIRSSRALHAAAEFERLGERTGPIGPSLQFGSASGVYHSFKRATGRTLREAMELEGALKTAVRVWRDRGKR